jgi:hypothetical protein
VIQVVRSSHQQRTEAVVSRAFGAGALVGAGFFFGLLFAANGYEAYTALRRKGLVP